MGIYNLQLKLLRTQKNISQVQMADLLGIKVARYRTWEYGTAMMSLEQAYNVTEILGCTLDELVGREPPSVAYADPDQTALNGYYRSMNGKGRAALVETAALMSGSPKVRIEKDGQEFVGIQAAMGA